DTTVGAGREPAAAQLRPALAAIARLPGRAAGPAAVEAAPAAAPLIARRIQRVGVARIHRDVRESRVVIDVLDLVPRLAPVGRLVHAAVRARSKQVAGHGDVHDVRVLWVDHDAGDRLR